MEKEKVNGLGLVMIMAGLGLLLSISLIDAAEPKIYHRFCLGDDESINIISGFSSISERLICRDGKCTCNLKSGSGFCDICVYEVGDVYSAPGLPSHCDFACQESGTGETEGLVVTANWPFVNGGVYTKQSFFLDITTNKISSIYLTDNIDGEQVNLCPNCNSVKKSKTFNKGFNNITIMAVSGFDIKYTSITFTIDNDKPRITKVEPISNKFADGNFIVNYDESSVKNVKLYYGEYNNGDYKLDIYDSVVALSGCGSGKKQTCSTNVNLGSYDGKLLGYWFEIEDLAGNRVKSRYTKVNVDKTFPVINSLNYTIKGTAVKFALNITEKNLYKVEYADFGDAGDGRTRTMCSSLSKGNLCNKQLGFKRGDHEVVIYVTDKVGNMVSSEPLMFSI
jgi:hypothetical protein